VDPNQCKQARGKKAYFGNTSATKLLLSRTTKPTPSRQERLEQCRLVTSHSVPRGVSNATARTHISHALARTQCPSSHRRSFPRKSADSAACEERSALCLCFQYLHNPRILYPDNPEVEGWNNRDRQGPPPPKTMESGGSRCRRCFHCCRSS
jgi:hypothetical protein